jgi:hypothetical protein
VRKTVPPGFRPRLHQRGQDRLRDRYPADPSRSREPGIADIGLRLPAAAADDRAPLHIRRGDGAHRHGAGPAHRGAGERWHVAFPGTERYAEPDLLGRGPGEAHRQQPQIADRLRRGRARPRRQYRAPLLGRRGRHARRAQARYRLDGPELAPQPRLARLEGAL